MIVLYECEKFVQGTIDFSRHAKMKISEVMLTALATVTNFLNVL